MTPHPQPGALRLLSATPSEFRRESERPAMDVVFVDGFVGNTIIGINANELDREQPVRIDVAAGVPRCFACSTDELEDTIDYGTIRALLVRELAEHRHRLVEALAESLAQRILAAFNADWVRVAVTKPRKFDDVDGVGVVIERRRPWSGERAPSLPSERSVLARLGAGMFPAPER